MRIWGQQRRYEMTNAIIITKNKALKKAYTVTYPSGFTTNNKTLESAIRGIHKLAIDPIIDNQTGE